MRTLDGAYLNHGSWPQYSLSSPVFQSTFIQLAQEAVDIGADGFMIDDIADWLGVILYLPAHNAGSFDSVTMAAFRDYLRQKYSSAVLQSQFGISDINSFDFGDYVRANGLADTWNQSPLKGLSIEFFLFKRGENLQFLRTLVATTKQYAQQKYARDILFSCNTTFGTNFLVRDVMDLTTPEAAYIRGHEPGTDHPYMAPDIRAWKGWKGPVIVFPEAFSPASGVPNPLDKPTVNLERVIIADIQAAGGVAAATTQMNLGLGYPQPVDLSVVRRYANFILNNPQLMSQTTTTSRVALLESAASIETTMLPAPGQPNFWAGRSAYMGTARMLLDSGITYDSVFLPNSSYSSLPSPSAQDLARYSVVVAPLVWALDDAQLGAILSYVQQGGTLVVFGGFGTNLPSGQQANRPQLETILPKSGHVSYGTGTIEFSSELFGVEYEQVGTNYVNVNMSAQRQARASFQALMVPYVQPDVKVSGVTAVVHEPGVTPFLYRDNAGRALVHLVNYDYDDATDQFYTKTNVGLSVRVGSQLVDEVVLRSPDIPGAQTIPFTRQGDTITLTVPVVDAWVVLLFQQNLYSPVISSASPATSLGAVGGTTFAFSVQASDRDGNPLTYTWTVNGQVVADILGPAYTLQLPLSATGVYTVAVAVTDGSRVVQSIWNVNVAAYKVPRILFDESHGELDTIDSATAAVLNAQHPDWVLLGTLATAMQPKYTISRLTTGSLTSQVLSSADVLVLAAPNNALTAAENQAITNFVQLGGGLVFLGKSYLSTSINALSSPWGIQFVAPRIESPQIPGSPGSFYLSSFANHPALGSSPALYENNGASLSVSAGAVSLGLTSAAEWSSPSGMPTQQPGEPNGPFVILAAAQVGKGRVFMSGTDAFTDVLAGATGNLDILLSALSWLTAAINPAPSPSTAAPQVLSVVNGASFGATVSPGSWVTIKGKALANTPPTGQIWSASDFNGNLLPNSLSGTSVTINGRTAAMEFISPAQLNVLAPDDAYQGTANVQVLSPYGVATSTANLQPLSPALFPVVAGDVTYAAAVGLDGLLIAPPAQIPGSRPARPGETLQLFGTGFGDTSPHQNANQLVNPSPLTNTVTATVCGQPATVRYGGLVGPGLNQINLVVPDGAAGNCAVQIFAGGVGTQTGVILLIGN
jgi:uncharacterized protein (TIGR03437 family)